MRWILTLWALPIAFLGTWYTLSYYDLNFGFFMLRRDVHDLVFQIYGDVLGVPPADVPPMVLKAIILDSFIVAGIYAWRKRAAIRAWWAARKGDSLAKGPVQSAPVAEALPIDDNLSRAP